MSVHWQLDDDARRAIELGVEEARLLGHAEVGEDHLLLGLARVDAGLIGVPIEALRARIVAGRAGETAGDDQDPELSPAADAAIGSTTRRGLQLARPADLLSALIERRGRAADALARIGVDSMLGEMPADVDESGGSEAEPGDDDAAGGYQR